MISKLSIARQFIVLAFLGVILTISGLALTLKRSHDLAYEAKRTEIQHEAEEGASIVRYFVQREQSGAMTKDEAQKRAIEAVGSIRFEEVNYVALLGFDGISISNANKGIVGKNIIDLVDPLGQPVTRAQLAVATSGHPGFAEFKWKKIGETEPKLKMSYNIGIPEWQWDVTTGDFADDLDSKLIEGIIQLAEIFIPLFLGFLAIMYFMRRSLSKLLGSLSGTMRRLAQGDLEVEIVGRERHDEIGQMADALVTFRQASIDKNLLAQEASNQRKIIETERLASEATKGEIQRQQQAVVTAIGNGLERLSKGDLTGRLTQVFSEEYEKLRTDFNATAESLQDALRTITVATNGISSGSEQIANASDDLSRRTEQQAASLEETAASLNVITETVKKMAANAGDAAKVVVTTRTAAESSGSVVQQAVDAMGKIKETSNKISNIIGVIDEIAFQTNLLALNAGVEAARAGDAGRGFAVVASEVRALAQRSAEAAKEIKALISASTVEVENGVVLVDRTGDALKDIIGKVAEMDSLVRQISAASQDQATGLAEINVAVGQMDQVVQQNAAMVEESTAAAHSLKGEAQDLTTMVGRFEIGGDKRGREPARNNPVQNTQASIAKSMAATPRRSAPIPMLKTTSSAAAQKDWEEF